MTRNDFSLILPCYNEGPTFEESFEKIYSVVKKIKRNWEIILVEDKSSDNTKEKVSAIIKNYKKTKVIYHKRNMGRGQSVSDGIVASSGKICGFIDIDCEVSPRYIPLFISEIEKGNDMVVGTRFYEKNFSSLVRLILSRGYSYIIKILFGLPIKDTETGYKFFNRKRILPLLSVVKDKGWFWDTEICVRAWEKKLKISELPVIFTRRSDKKSTVKVVSDTLDYFVKLYNFKFNRNA